MRHRMVFICAICGLTLASTASWSAAGEEERSEAERRFARELEPDVTKGLARADFLRQFPKAKLETYEKDTGFRSYKLLERVNPIQVRYWYFVDDELATSALHVNTGRQLPDDKTKALMRGLGVPDSDDIDPADKRAGMILHSRWFFDDDNVEIQYKVSSDRRLGYVYIVLTSNTEVIDKLRAKRMK